MEFHLSPLLLEYLFERRSLIDWVLPVQKGSSSSMGFSSSAPVAKSKRWLAWLATLPKKPVPMMGGLGVWKVTSKANVWGLTWVR